MKKILFFIFSFMICGAAVASDLEIALRNTYTNCVGIEEQLSAMKKMAGINTAVTGVGTGLGIGAVAVGIAKKNVDAELEKKFQKMDSWAYGASGDVDVASSEDWLKNFEKSDGPSYGDENNTINGKKTFQELNDKSKKLGNWRTGLLVGNTVTNVAGSVIAASNRVDETLQEQIQNCAAALRNLKKVIAQARIDGLDITEAVEIESACGGVESLDAENIEKINKMATGGMVSALVGTGTGVVGTITSAIANSDRIRKDDTEQGKKKERNLNTAANVLAAGSTVASAAATVFNASQIKTIQEATIIAEKCTEVLR